MKKFIIVGFAVASLLGQYAAAEAAQNHQACARRQMSTQSNSISGQIVVQSGERATLFSHSDGG
jgi:hypothetical protein